MEEMDGVRRKTRTGDKLQPELATGELDPPDGTQSDSDDFEPDKTLDGENISKNEVVRQGKNVRQVIQCHDLVYLNLFPSASVHFLVHLPPYF
jgi:hypothetical protein